ncbi:hypothetical protein B5F53_11830 [Blautia sp. An249]|uniref:hypothetical protein n=1 Tax=Blautia sp. An249 TaxID=1965603 RepID=UPI000B364EFC|nr:hypothetical protein [Blautia sp. An249]OUO77898.1 hypothetical protein B5F53_11830 [Blautia sp. An249]
MDLDLKKTTVEKVDIMGEAQRVLSELRKHAEEVKTKENLAQYDDGVKHALVALESVLNTESDSEKRLIYQKNGFSSPYIRRYVSLESALEEIYGGD